MKKQNLLASTIMMAVTGASTTAFAVPSITDYQEATSSYDDAYISGNFNASDGNQGQSSYNLDLDLDYEKVLSSPDRNTKLDFNGSGSLSKGSTLGAESTNTYQALGSATVDNYFTPGSKAGFWYGKGELGALKGAESIYSKATVGLGYGRVVNVTPMARSIRIIEELRENGFLKADPSNAVYNAVAKIIDKEDEYRSKHGSADYQQYWVQDIHSAIQSSGAVKGNLNARAILSAYDVLTNETISTRKNGWLVRAGVGAVLSDYDGQDGKPALELGAEYHRPISNQIQFSNEAIATATLKDSDDGFNFNNAMSLTQEVSDKIDWVNKWNLAHSESDNAKRQTTNTLSSAFLYKISNQLDFGVEARLTDDNDRTDFDGTSNTVNNDDIDKSLNIGIKYRLK